MDYIAAFDVLMQGGMTLPNPEVLDDGQLTGKLWEEIRALAMFRIYIGEYAPESRCF